MRQQGSQLLLGSRKHLGRVVLNRSPLEGNENSKLWRLLFGSEQRVVAVAEAMREDSFILLAGYVNWGASTV